MSTPASMWRPTKSDRKMKEGGERTSKLIGGKGSETEEAEGNIVNTQKQQGIFTDGLTYQLGTLFSIEIQTVMQ